MRIVLDGRTIQDHFPGIGRYTYNLAAALPHALATALPGADLALLYDPHQPNTRYDMKALGQHGIALVPCEASVFSLIHQGRVRRSLRAQGATLYHSPYYLMPYLPGVRAVVTIHDLIPLLQPQDYSARTRLMYLFAVRLAAARARQIITDSASAASDLTRLLGVPPDKVTAIHVAAEAGFQPQTLEVVAAVRTRLELPETYVLYFGSNKAHKNLPRLVGAYLSLPASVPPLVIAGHWDPGFPEARALADACGAVASQRIRFAGPVASADLPALYTGTTLFVFPSLYEGFGLPPLEAMACGAPVAVSNTSSLPEIVGEAGWTFDPADEADMARVLSQALGAPDRLAAMRTRSLEQAAKYSWASAAERVAAVYKRVLALEP